MARLVGAMLTAAAMAVLTSGGPETGRFSLSAAAIAQPVLRTGGPVAVRVREACEAGHFRTTGTDAREPTIYAVRTGPGAEYPPLDTAKAGERAWACEERAEAADTVTADSGDASDAAEGGEVATTRWTGVVYGSPRNDCEPASGGAGGRTYTGPCRWGWIESDNFQRDNPMGGLVATRGPDER